MSEQLIAFLVFAVLIIIILSQRSSVNTINGSNNQIINKTDNKIEVDSKL